MHHSLHDQGGVGLHLGGGALYLGRGESPSGGEGILHLREGGGALHLMGVYIQREGVYIWERLHLGRGVCNWGFCIRRIGG